MVVFVVIVLLVTLLVTVVFVVDVVDVVALIATHIPLVPDPIDDTTSTSIPFEALHSHCVQPHVYPMLTQNCEIAGRHVLEYSLVRAIQPAYCVRHVSRTCRRYL